MNRNITAKQHQILTLLSEGYNSEEIANTLGNSKKTIDKIRFTMLRKFQAKNVAHLVAIGFRKKWIE